MRSSEVSPDLSVIDPKTFGVNDAWVMAYLNEHKVSLVEGSLHAIAVFEKTVSVLFTNLGTYKHLKSNKPPFPPPPSPPPRPRNRCSSAPTPPKER